MFSGLSGFSVSGRSDLVFHIVEISGLAVLALAVVL
jgi:hypothetical protein